MKKRWLAILCAAFLLMTGCVPAALADSGPYYPVSVEEYARLRIRAQKQNEVFAAACGLTIENTDSCAADFEARCKAIFQTLLKEDP